MFTSDKSKACDIRFIIVRVRTRSSNWSLSKKACPVLDEVRECEICHDPTYSKSIIHFA